MRLFIDLDGVMFDFDGHYLNMFGHEAKDAPTKDDMWRTIATRPNFFTEMPVMDGAADFLHRYSYLPHAFLTHVPNNKFGLSMEEIARQKRQAIQQSFGHSGLVIPVIGRPIHVPKALFMDRPGDVLVDDWPKNIQEWEAAGGVGVLHRNFTETSAAIEWRLYLESHPHEMSVS